MPHDLRDDDAVVAVRRAVQAVERLGGDAERGVEPDRGVGQGDVVVDRLRDGKDVEALFDQP